jgi:caffeoyl-CoA O-methyltransferase
MADQSSRSGTRYATPEILGFVEGLHAAHDGALQRAYDAPVQHGMPAIQLAVSEGKLLALLIRIAAARKVVEVGTLAGYSALRIARALPEGGTLWTLEIDPRHARVAEDNLAAGGVSDRVQVLVGPAQESLARLTRERPFDAVFLDADKAGYPEYARWAHANLRPGGLLIADNSYFFGQLMAETPEAARMREFHEFVARSFDSVCVPTPDGMVLGIR